MCWGPAALVLRCEEVALRRSCPMTVSISSCVTPKSARQNEIREGNKAEQNKENSRITLTGLSNKGFVPTPLGPPIDGCHDPG